MSRNPNRKVSDITSFNTEKFPKENCRHGKRTNPRDYRVPSIRSD